MNVLHYSLSLSACPKCHLFICKHTSLADLDLNSNQETTPSNTLSSNTQTPIRKNLNTSSQQNASGDTNVYLFSSTANDNRHSWTTVGTNSIENADIFHNLLPNNETLCDNIPFAHETIISSILPLTPSLTHIVRTQSEKFDTHFPNSLYLTKSFSFSTLYNKRSLLLSYIKPKDRSLVRSYSYSNACLFIILSLILSFLITNTIDIVLFYIYYHANYLYLISYISALVLCDIILWINNLIQFNTVPSCLLLLPLITRPYLLYKLVELLTIILEKTHHASKLDSASSSSSTTATYETNGSHRTDSSMLNQLSSYKIKKRRLFHYLTLFYTVHTGFITLINIFFWSNNFQLSNKSSLNMNYFIPQWIQNDDYLLSPTSSINAIPDFSSIA